MTVIPQALTIPAKDINIDKIQTDNKMFLDINIQPWNIKPGVKIYDMVGTYTPVETPMPEFDLANGLLEGLIPEGYYDGTVKSVASDTNLVEGNLLPGVTIFGVTSNVAEGTTIIDAQAVTPILIPAGYYDGTTYVQSA